MILRYHCGCRCCPSRYGVRRTRPTPTSIRLVFIFHGRPHLLVLRYLKGYYYWGELLEVPCLCIRLLLVACCGHVDDCR